MRSVLLLALSLAFVAQAEDLVRDRELVGWLGDTYSGSRASDDGSGMIVLSWEPRIFLYRKFLTPEECDFLIKKSGPRLMRSGVSDSVTGLVRCAWMCKPWVEAAPQHAPPLVP